jgi:enamine deaminase RidA (YjgF/YER057c/UK114 family)
MSAEAKKMNPVPQGKYLPATRYGDIVYTSGMTPRKNGVLIFEGKVSSSESLDTYREAIRLAVANALTAARNVLAGQEHLARVLSLTVFIAADETFQAHSRLADFASEYLHQEIGDAGIGSRAAIGVASLPGNAPVEIQLVAAISTD